MNDAFETLDHAALIRLPTAGSVSALDGLANPELTELRVRRPEQVNVSLKS